MTDPADPRDQIDNALTMLAGVRHADPHAVAQSLEIAVKTLRAARAGLDELNAELDLLTAPEKNAAKEALRLRREIDERDVEIAGLQQELAMLRQKLDVEVEVHAEEQQRLAQLEKKSAQVEAMLMDDDEAFTRYVERAIELDEHKRSSGKRPKH